MVVYVKAGDNAGLDYISIKIPGKERAFKYFDNAPLTYMTDDNDFVFRIDWSKTLLSGYDVNITVADVNGNGNYTNTHIDGLVEGVIKALVNAFHAFVDAVKELASAALEWIMTLMQGIANKILAPILDLFRQFGNKLADILSSINLTELSDGRDITWEFANAKLGRLIWDLFILPIAIIEIIMYALMALEILGKSIPGVFDIITSAIGPLIAGALIGCLLGAIGDISIAAFGGCRVDEPETTLPLVKIGAAATLISKIVIFVIKAVLQYILSRKNVEVLGSATFAFLSLIISLSLTLSGITGIYLFLGDLMSLLISILGAVYAYNAAKKPIELTKQTFSSIYRVFAKYFTIIVVGFNII
jgi:hypothetical protein